MGFLSDVFKAVASEVATAVMDSVNETVRAEEEKEIYIEEMRKKYAGMSYDSLADLSEYEELGAEEAEAINNLIEEREQYAKAICESPEEILSEFDDDDLVEYYISLLETRGNAFPEAYVKKVVKRFRDEVMSRKVAKSMYAKAKQDCFDNCRYDELKDIIWGNSAFYDDILKAEAKSEFEYRSALIEALSDENIEELDNDEFMELYALVRADKSKTDYFFDGQKNEIEGTYNEYFGEHRDMLLKNCENEILRNRKYLIKQFVSEYCEENVEEYYNYSSSKLTSIVSLFDNETKNEENDYDLCDKLIAETILAERGCE